ncbi:MAG: hypothetical protein HY043_22060 [Verrucomicrobia bacterium]|nr:hypothetical protein [Verrucomicrobiota bacterium]
MVGWLGDHPEIGELAADKVSAKTENALFLRAKRKLKELEVLEKEKTYLKSADAIRDVHRGFQELKKQIFNSLKIGCQTAAVELALPLDQSAKLHEIMEAELIAALETFSCGEWTKEK